MPSRDWNKTWDRGYEWSQGGDEWTGQAEYCGQPYEAWKQSILDKFPSLSNFDKAGVKRRFLSLVDAATRQWHSIQQWR